MNQVSACSSTATLEKDVPVIRLKNDADLSEIYEYRTKLGQGGFGAVYEATHIETQTKWAIKEVCRPAAGSSKVKMVDNEISILNQINHAHVLHLEAVYSSNTRIYLVSELCKGGDLRQLLDKKKFFTEDETRKIIFCLADAVAYLHKRDIVHRDLKLENILLKNSLDEDDGSFDIKVADFGLSVKTGGVGIDNIMTDACGTLIYMETETLKASSLTSSEDNLETSLTSLVLTADPEDSCGSHAKLHPERDRNPCTSSTSIKLSHAGEKSSKQLTSCRPHGRKDPSTGRKLISGSSKANDQRPSSSRKVRPASANQQLSQRTIPV
ncbi:serine/threonine-protein kinase 33 [Xenentodon cancila]